MSTSLKLSPLAHALPFWATILLIPLAIISATLGGWALLLLPVMTWLFFSFLDAVLGLELSNQDPAMEESHLKWHKAITLTWAPIQFLLIYWTIWYATSADHLSGFEMILLFFGIGVITGTVGINYSHELMHQKDKGERFMADALLGMVLYSHFRSEHLLVHHRYIGTPRDPVTARYNEGFHRFFPRVLISCLKSGFKAEADMLERKGKPWTDLSNPFWRYWGLQAYFLLLAVLIGGWVGVLLFLWQALVAVWQLELVNYIEHYGLTRKHLGDGKYEHVLPRHSWNAAHKASNWLLLNLQRHSDHHYKPSRRFPLLQNYTDADAPQLPYGYPLMTMAALVPPLWRRMMNPRVRRWRQMYYPEISDWKPYNKALNPQPRQA